VLDSSVIVKWFSKEEKSDKALELMESHLKGDIELSVSELSICEVANALRYKPDYDSKKLKIAISQLFKLHLNIYPLHENLLVRASEIAYDGNVTLYDAIPVAAAENQETACVTADEETQYGKLNIKSYPIKVL